MGDEGARPDACPSRHHRDLLVGGDTESAGVRRRDLHVDLRRGQLAQDRRLGGARLGVPLARAAAPAQEREGVALARRLGQRTRILEQEPRLAVPVEEASVLEQTSLTGGQLYARRERPLHPALAIQHRVIADPRDVTGLPPGDLLQDLEDRLGAAPTSEGVPYPPR